MSHRRTSFHVLKLQLLFISVGGEDVTIAFHFHFSTLNTCLATKNKFYVPQYAFWQYTLVLYNNL